QPSLMSGFSESVELGQIGEIKKDSTVVMRVQTGKPVGYPLLRWRGIALSTFDGHRWASRDLSHQLLLSGPDGWINLAAPGALRAPIFGQLSYTVLLQPLASDAIFVPGHVLAL